MFFHNFWNFSHFQTNDRLKKLLSDQETSLDELFKEENLASDVKHFHEKFTKFITSSPEKLEQLIDYCILSEQQILDKYPNAKVQNPRQKSKTEDQSDSQSDEKIQQEDAVKEEEQQQEEEVQTSVSKELPFVASELFVGQPPNLIEYLFNQYHPEDDKSDDEDEQQKQNSGDIDDIPDNKELNLIENEDQNQDQEQEQDANNKDEKEDVEKTNEDQEKKVEEQQQEIQQEQEKQNEEPVQKYDGRKILSHIFTFLDRSSEEPNFDTSAGYFSKILGILISREGKFFKFLKEDDTFSGQKTEEIFQKLIKHIANSSIQDLIFRLIASEGNQVSNDNDLDDQEEDSNKKVEDIYSDFRQNLLQKCFQKLTETTSIDEVQNLVTIIGEVVDLVGNPERNNIGFYDNLIPVILNQETLTTLFSKLINSEKNEEQQQYIQAITTVLQQIFLSFRQISKPQTHNHDQDDDTVIQNEEDDHQMQENHDFPFDIYAQQIQPLLQIIDQHLNQQDTPDATNQTKTQFTRFGLGNLQILELLQSLLKSQNEALFSVITNQNTQFFQIIFKTFFQYQWNSLVQTCVYKISEQVFQTKNIEVITAYIKGSNILNKIMDNFQVKTKPGQYSTKIHQGFQGFLVQLGLLIQTNRGVANVEELITSQEGWIDFSKESLKDTLSVQIDHQWGTIYDENNKDEAQDLIYSGQKSSPMKNEPYKGPGHVAYTEDFLKQQRSMFDDDDEEEEQGNGQDQQTQQDNNVENNNDEDNQQENKEYGNQEYWKISVNPTESLIDDLLSGN